MTFRFKLLHHFTCQIEASGAVAGDCEDEGLWRFPGAEVFFGDGEANGEALGGGRAGGRDGHSIAQGGDGDGAKVNGFEFRVLRSGEGVGLEVDDHREILVSLIDED